MRCIECGEQGHFKCRSEFKSNLMKLSFTVRGNLDEFIDEISEKNAKKKKKSKDSKKKKSKKLKKKKRARRLSNSNIIIPETDSEPCDDSSSSSEEEDRMDYNTLKRKR